MIEIIPNWHPIFVHFTVALLSLAVCFYIIHPFFKEGIIKQHFYILSRWNLWLGTGFSLITGVAGWFAYNSVLHDATSHAAMTEHRNWALVTIGLFTLLTAWSFRTEIKKLKTGNAFLFSLLIAGVFLFSTAWHGAESVYRYGLGVMSLPQAEDDGHDHDHEHKKVTPDDMKNEVMQSMENHDDSNIAIQNEDKHLHYQSESEIEVDNKELEPIIEREIEETVREPDVQDTHDHSSHEH